MSSLIGSHNRRNINSISFFNSLSYLIGLISSLFALEKKSHKKEYIFSLPNDEVSKRVKSVALVSLDVVRSHERDLLINPLRYALARQNQNDTYLTKLTQRRPFGKGDR
jgi:hypothetical protein